MKRKLSLIMVVVMLGVMFTGCSLSVEEYKDEFESMKLDYLVLRMDFTLEMDKQMDNLELYGFGGVDSSDLMLISGDMMIMDGNFHNLDVPSSLTDKHKDLSLAYMAYSASAYDFYLAIDDMDIDSAITAVKEMSKASDVLVAQEAKMTKELGL